ncbi:hypothetical protein HYV31_04230 [candidate division WWE3 bacterium]|nr:hypothetical protein [candidate division WWE3 bacterium]
MTLNKIRRLGLDFDGTIASDFDPKNFLHIGTKAANPIHTNYIYRFFDILVTMFGTSYQTPQPNIQKFLETNNTIDFFIITGRPNYVARWTLVWLKKNNLLQHFKEIYFNRAGTSPLNNKLTCIKDHELDGHIDDNPIVILELAKKFPNKVFVLLNPVNSLTESDKFSNIFWAKNWIDVAEIIEKFK